MLGNEQDFGRGRASEYDPANLIASDAAHRVSNALQLAMALINQVSKLPEIEAAVPALHLAQAKLAALGEINRRLMPLAASEAIGNVAQELSTVAKCVAFVFTDPRQQQVCQIDISVDVPPTLLWPKQTIGWLCMIANEMVTNACKHAFSERSKGRIDIAVELDSPGMAKLCIRDNGCGRAEGGAESRSGNAGGHGMRLTEAQAAMLGGSLLVESQGAEPSNGRCVTVTFPVPRSAVIEVVGCDVRT